MKEEIIAKIFPIVIKPYSGAGILMNNSLPFFGLTITNQKIVLKFLGLAMGKILIDEVIGFKPIDAKFVGTQLIFKGIVIRYNYRNKVKEEVVDTYSQSKKQTRKSTGLGHHFS